MLSDDDLAKIAHQARQKGRFAPTWDELTVKWPWEQEEYRRIARAVRAALLPEAAPLRPGETVTIPTANEKTGGLRIMAGKTLIAVSMLTYEGEWQGRFLDAAGVATLIETCRRWQQAQEGDK